MIQDMLLSLCIILAIYGVIIAIAEASFRAGLDSFATRKVAHICCGLLTATLPFFLTLPYAVATGLLLSLFVFISKHFRIFKGIEHSDQLSWGTLYFPLGFIISAALFWNENPLIFSGSALILGLADGLAALFGKRFGRKKLPNSSKSYFGTVVFAAVTFVICLSVYFEKNGSLEYFNYARIIISLIGSIAVACVEAVSKDGTDNLFIPLCGGVLLYLVI